MSVKNISEILFERYLTEQRLTFEFEKLYPGKSKRVDYTVPIDGRDFLFEVKQFEQRNYPLPTSVSAVDYYGPLRSKIDQAQKKFKEYEEFPCCLVLYTNEAFVMDSPRAVYGAMYGDVGISIPVAAGRVTIAMPVPEPTFVGNNGKMMRFNQASNTRISAIIHIYEYLSGLAQWRRHFAETKEFMSGNRHEHEVFVPDLDGDAKCVAVSVWENYGAKVSLPDSAFRGLCDERWGLVGDYIRCKYKGPGRYGDDDNS